MNAKSFKKTVILSLFAIFIVPIVIFFAKMVEYKKYTNDAFKSIPFCNKEKKQIYSVQEIDKFGNDGCFEKMYHLLLPKLLSYKAIYKGEEIKITRYAGFFALVNELIKESDAFLSWGIGPTANFEIDVTTENKINTYVFDCGTSKEDAEELNKIPYMHVQRECLGTDKYVMYGQKSTGKIHSLGQKIKELNLQDKKLFLKLGIPETHEYVDDILKNKNNILGFAIAINLWSPRYIIDDFEFLDKLNNNFVLVYTEPSSYLSDKQPKIQYINGLSSSCISLTFVNKDILDKYYIPLNQDNFNIYKTKMAPKETKRISPAFEIIIFEKIKKIKSKLHQVLNW